TAWKDAVSPNSDGERDEIKVDYLALPMRVHQDVVVLNEAGQTVRKIFSGKKDELLNHQTWSGKGEGNSTLLEGSYNIRITASNQNGQNSDSLALFLDRTKPVVVSTSPSEGETIGIGSHEDDKKIELKAVLTDNLSGLAEAELKLNGEKIELDEYKGNDLRKEISEKISTKKLKDGKNVFEVTACDRGRNRVLKQIAFYKGGIEIVIVEPASGSRVRGTVSVKAKPERDSDYSRIASIRYEIRKNTSVVLTQTSTISPFATTFNTVGIADGEYDLLAVAKDKSGNEYTSPKIKVTLDNTAPTITFNQANPSVALGSPFTISGKIVDAAGIASLSVNGSTLSLGSGGTFTTTAPLVDGNNNFQFMGKDTVGNQSTITFTATFDNLPPVITNITPVSLTVFKSTPQSISFQVIDSSLASV
ncbi:MAG: hypothetical protein JNM63_18755, partial [Spirochaetia bacterium]|nr:hypothetical protein [Spirochaetia bacterium]